MASHISPQALLVTGVYGVGKTSLVEEIADLLERIELPYAAIDIDWLSWFNVPSSAESYSAIWLANVGDIVGRYVASGVRYLALAHSVPDAAALANLREAIAVPTRVVGLRLDHPQISHRLASAVTRGRTDDLRAAREWVLAGRGVGFEDLVIDADRPIRTLALEVLAWLDWLPAAPPTLT
jgi:hypothetical protein